MTTGVKRYTYGGYTRSVNAVAWSPDGSYLAVGSSDGTVRVWNSVDWSVVATYTSAAKADRGGVYAIAWSADGHSVAANDLLNNKEQWSIAVGDNFQNAEAPGIVEANINTPVTPHPKWFHTTTNIVGHINIRIEKEYTEAKTLSPRTFMDRSLFYEVLSIDPSPDERYIAFGCHDGTILVRDHTLQKFILACTHHIGGVSAVTWSRDGRYIASGGYDKTVRVWSASTGEVVYVFRGHSNTILDLSWRPGSKQLVSGSWDKTARLWDITSKECIHIYRGHSGPVNTVGWSPNGEYIASGSWDHTVQVWESV